MASTKVQCLEASPVGKPSLGVRGGTTKSASSKRKLGLPEANARRERQAKYTKKTRNVGVFERFIRNSVGLDSLTSGVVSKPLRLFDRAGFVESAKVLQLDYDRGKEKNLETIYKRHTFDAIGKIGFGVASPILMANLLKDLRGRVPSGLNECRFSNVNAEPGKSSTDKASYAFFHWDRSESGSSGVISDYRLRNYFLSQRTVREIDGLGFGICRVLFPGKFETLSDDAMKEHILLLPGVVITKRAHDQALHLDDQPGEILFLLHFPLCEEGMVLRVWGKANNERNNMEKANYLRIPFGSYAITRGDVYHAGIYGKKGNFRFHMVVKTADKFTVSDRLHKMEGDKNPEPNKWKVHLYEQDEQHHFSVNYLAMLKEKCGCIMEDGWTRTLDL
jgi:hypothetical protein